MLNVETETKIPSVSPSKIPNRTPDTPSPHLSLPSTHRQSAFSPVMKVDDKNPKSDLHNQVQSTSNMASNMAVRALPFPDMSLAERMQFYPPFPMYPPFSDLHAPNWAYMLERRRRKETRPRRQRTTFSNEQTLRLEIEFQRSEYITRPRRFELAEMLSLTETQVKIWYQNRRAKDKRIEKAQMDQHVRALNMAAVYGRYPMTSLHPAAFCGACLYKPATPTSVTSQTVPTATNTSSVSTNSVVASYPYG